jgi:hypothetical protein
MNIVEQYFPKAAENDKLVRYLASLSLTRQRVHVLEQSVHGEGTKSP